MVANLNTNVNIPSFQFPPSEVKGAFVNYTIARVTSTASGYETGKLMLSYNPDNPTNNKWEIQREYIGEASVTFTITDAGQVRFSSTSLSGINHEGTITFTAQSLIVT